jgi:3',5'-cyclic AMP phosphodiesterase CpdA
VRRQRQMKIAHFSDLHLLSLDNVPAYRFLNKRLTGWVNLRLKRGHVHRAAYVRAIAQEIARIGVDHVVVTGDLTNLALEPEFELARDVLERDLGFDPSRVTIVPGNHDAYTRGAHRTGRFERYFGRWLQSDMPDLASSGSVFPSVKIRGDVAIVALSSAVPRAPLVAAGELGPSQLSALQRILAHEEVARRQVIIAIHHPPVHRYSRLKTHLEGLRDAPALLALLENVARGLVLHGHLHRRIVRGLPSKSGILQVGATSASLHHDAPDRMAGFNVYEIGEDSRAVSVLAHVYAPESGTFQVQSVPRHV